MRLFHQLEDQEQSYAVSYCSELVIEDLFDGTIAVDMLTDDEMEKMELQDLLEYGKDMDKQSKLQLLIEDELASKYVLHLAIDLAKTAYYHDSDDFVIFTDELTQSIEKEPSNEEECEECAKEELENNAIINTFDSSKKKILN